MNYPVNYAIPQAYNRLIAITVGLFHAVVLIVLPVYLLPQSLYWALLPLPFLWLANTQWGLIHEAIHKILYRNHTANEYAGRTLSILMGTSFAVLRFGHLMHHKLNRQWHSEHALSSRLSDRFYYYANLFFGLYVGEIIMGFLLAVLPRPLFLRLARATFLKHYPDVVVSGERFFYDRGNIHGLRVDIALVTLLYTGAFIAYGAYYPILIAYLLLRAFAISFLDNIYHYDTPADNTKAGKELTLVEPLSTLLLHSNYHETHHLNPSVPWRYLPEVHARQNRQFDGDFLTHGRMQFRGPVVGSAGFEPTA